MSAVAGGFFVTGGTLRHDAPSYIERRADHDLLDGLTRGAFCYVLTSRQMGKSSLMVRTAAKLREHGAQVVVLDLTAVGQNVTPEQWYDGMIVRMAGQLRLENELEEFWAAHPRLSPVQRFFEALRNVVLPHCSGPLVVFVDEIDVVRSLPFPTDEFFAAIREIYNRRTEQSAMQRVTFCLLGVAAPSDLIRDTRTTPFNVGQRIELNDFTAEEAFPLARGLTGAGTEAKARAALVRVLHWTQGQPYLTQRLCQALASRQAESPQAIDDACDVLFLTNRAREQDDNLLFVRDRLLRGQNDPAGVLTLYSDVFKGRPPVPDDAANPIVGILRLSGIVRSEKGRLRVRNRIYARVFDRKWIDSNMPGAELRRQRAAFYRGVIRTTAIAAVVVAVTVIAAVIAVKQAAKARRALALAYFSQAQATRKSGLAGQRHDSLGVLAKAREGHTNFVALRDETLACLALVDLQRITNGVARLPPNRVTEMSPSLEFSAEAGDSGAILVRRLSDGIVLASLPETNSPVVRMRFGATEEILAAEYYARSRSQIVVWNWRTQKPLFTVAHGISGEAMEFTADGRRLAVGNPSGIVTVFALPRGEVVRELELKRDTGGGRAPHMIRLDPAGELLATSSKDDQYVDLWDLATSQRVGRLYHAGVVYDLAWHPSGNTLAAACEDFRVYLWQTNDLRNPVKLTGHEGAVMALDYSRSGNVLASLGKDESVRLWIPATGRQMAGEMAGERLDRLRFNRDDTRLIASGRNPPQSRVFAVSGGELTLLEARTGRGHAVRSIDFSPDSRWLLAASGKQITFWQTGAGRELGTMLLPHARAAWFDAGGSNVLVSSDSGIFKWPLLPSETTEPPRLRVGAAQRLYRTKGGDEFETRLKWVETDSSGSGDKLLEELGMMATSLDRRTAVVVHREVVIRVPLEFNATTDISTYPLGMHHPQLALHPQATWLATQAGGSNVLHLWNLSESGGDAFIVPGGGYFGFSPDGSWLAVCWAAEFRFYRVGQWSQPAFIVRRILASDQHAPVAFARDGRTVALASSRYIVQLRSLPRTDAHRSELIATLESPDRLPLESLTFSPDGRYLAAATDRQAVLLWNLAALGDGLAKFGLRRDWPEPR